MTDVFNNWKIKIILFIGLFIYFAGFFFALKLNVSNEFVRQLIFVRDDDRLSSKQECLFGTILAMDVRKRLL